jgi:hypothetical protein
MCLRLLLLIFLVLAGALESTALAQNKAAAEAAFREGRELLAADRVAEACDKFSLSQRLDPAIGTLLNLADCHERMGKLASAWAEFNEAAVRAAREGQSRRAEEAERRAQLLEPRLTRLLLEVDPDNPTALAISRDSVDITLLVGTPTPVDPGEVVMEARASGYKPWTAKVALVGEGRTIVIKVPALEPDETLSEGPGTGGAGQRSAAVVLDPVVDAAPSRTRAYAGLALGGAGVVAVGVGGVFGLRARSLWRDSRADCNEQNECHGHGYDLVKDAQSAANVSTILVGGGLAVLVGGAVLWFTAPSVRVAEQSGALRIAPGPGDVGVALGWGF